MSIVNKRSWKQLAPKPFSSLRLWCNYNTIRQQQQKILSNCYYLTQGDYSDSDSIYSDYSDDDSLDWLDSTLASLDQQEFALDNCIIKSIPAVGFSSDANDQNSSFNGKRKHQQSKDCQNKRQDKKKKVKSDEEQLADLQLTNQEEELDIVPVGQAMKILDVNESKSIVVLKKCAVNYLTIIYGDARVSQIVGKICLDGYNLKPKESILVSSGFGSYQIVIKPLDYQNYPTDDHLVEVLESGNVPNNLHDTIVEYLRKGSSFYDCIIISLEKWKWPSLTALRLLIKPEINFSHWFQISFSETRSPTMQWNYLIGQLVDDINKRILKIRSNKQKNVDPKDPSSKRVAIVIVGGANSGKSSLVRHLSNKIVSEVSKKVHIIDCDPGQSEFTPPGLLTAIKITEPILSPPFVNCLRFNRDIIASSSIAGCAVTNNPDLYLTSFTHLWKTFIASLEEDDSDKPVLINTMGWTQGIGIHLMVDVLRTVQPTHVIEIKRRPFDGQNNFPFDCNPDTVNGLNGWSAEIDKESLGNSSSKESLHGELKPYLNYDYIRISNHLAPKRCGRENRTNRVNNQLSYLCLMDEILFKNVAELPTVHLDLETICFHVQHEFPIDKHLIPHIIRNSWVHLCSVDEQDLQASELQPAKTSNQGEVESISQRKEDETAVNRESNINETEARTSSNVSSEYFQGALNQAQSDAQKLSWGDDCPINLKILPFLRKNICLGSAIVRDIDITNKRLILLTPESSDRLAKVNCVVRPQGIFVPEQLL